MKKIILRVLMVIGAFILIVAGNLVFFNITASRISKGEPIANPGSDQTALLIIDIQEGTTGTISITESYQEQSEALIGNLNRIAKEAVEEDWPVIYIRSEVVNPLLNLLNNTMARGSEGARMDKRLNILSEYIVTKRKNDSFLNTPLDSILVENNIGRVVLTGLDAGHCVDSAVRAALNRNYRVAVIPEAIIAKDKSDIPAIIDQFRELGVEIIE